MIIGRSHRKTKPSQIIAVLLSVAVLHAASCRNVDNEGSISEYGIHNETLTEAEKGSNDQPEQTAFGESLLKYTNNEYMYSIYYPDSWTIEEGPVSYGYRVKWTCPDNKSVFLVDSSHTGGIEDPCEWPKKADENHRSNTPSYALIDLRPLSFKGYDACVWEHSIGGLTIKDVFIEGSLCGYAVLFKTESYMYEEKINTFTEIILESFQPDYGI